MTRYPLRYRIALAVVRWVDRLVARLLGAA